MRQTIEVKHINALKSAKAKFSEVGDISYELTFDVVLDPGDLERLLLLFKQQIPRSMSITSPQSKMDLAVILIEDKPEKTETIKGRSDLPTQIIFDDALKIYKTSDTTAHLCGTCDLHFAECKSDPTFGDGVGHDNVIACNLYKLLGSPEEPKKESKKSKKKEPARV